MRKFDSRNKLLDVPIYVGYCVALLTAREESFVNMPYECPEGSQFVELLYKELLEFYDLILDFIYFFKSVPVCLYEVTYFSSLLYLGCLRRLFL